MPQLDWTQLGTQRFQVRQDHDLVQNCGAAAGQNSRQIFNEPCGLWNHGVAKTGADDEGPSSMTPAHISRR
jgi:hypothetical protein